MLLAAGDDAGMVTVWRPDLGQLITNDIKWASSNQRIEPIASLTPHTSRVTSIAVTSEATLLSSSEDGRVASTAPFAIGATHTRWEGIQVNDAELNANELLLACEDGTIRQYLIKDSIQDSETLEMRQEEVQLPDVFISGPSPVSCVALSPNGDLVASGTRDCGVHLYQRDTGKKLRSLVDDKPQANDVTAICFSANGQLLASTGENGFATVHNIATGEVLLSHQLGNTGQAISFLEDDRFLACGGNFEGIRIIDTKTGALSQTVAGDNTNSLSVSPNGQWFASAHSNGTIQTTELSNDMQTRVIRGKRTAVGSTTMSSDGRTVISLDGHNILQFTDSETGIVFGRLKLPDHDDNSQVYCRDNLLLMIGNEDDAASHLYSWRIGDQRKSHD